MSFDNPFENKIITQYRQGTQNDPLLDVTEMVSVVNSQAVLSEIPYKFSRVQIIERVGASNVNFYEIESVPFTSEYQYYVDYGEGLVNFHPSQEGVKFVVSYKGRGFHSLNAQRVYTKVEGNRVTETLQDVVSEGTEKITEIIDSIAEANTATINANNATADFETLLDNQKLVYKPSVNTYSDIAIAYPSPSIGWTTVTKDTGTRYRYDGFSWVDIGLSTEGNGFTVIIGSTPPVNTNTLWVDATGANRTAKVVQSSTPPTDTSVIWWKVD